MNELDWNEVRFEEISAEQFARMKSELKCKTGYRNKAVIHDFEDYRVVEIYAPKSGLTKYLRQERPRK